MVCAKQQAEAELPSQAFLEAIPQRNSDELGLAGVISSQIKPYRIASPEVDAEKLATVVRRSLKPDGTLAGRPESAPQSGLTQGNRILAQRHAELAIRAVELAVAFKLPSKAPRYPWFEFRFDRKILQ